MNPIWTLSRNGAPARSLADWGFRQAHLSLKSQAMDTFTVRQGAPFDSNLVLAYGDAVVLAKGGVTWFAGRVDDPELYGSAKSERITHAMVGPWWWLTKEIYRWTRQMWNGSELVPAYSDHVFLGMNPVDGSHITTGGQIKAVLDWAIARGAPIQYDDSTFPDLLAPFTEVRSLYCSEVIRRMLQLTPDCTVWWDYTTAPYPTFRCARRASQGSILVPISGAEENTFKPRYSLQLPSVAITYESSTYVQGVKYLSQFTDIAPNTATGLEPGALAVTIDLDGGNFAYASGKILTEPIHHADLDLTERLAWWQKKVPWLASDLVDQSTVVIAPDNMPAYTNELVDGTVAPWMVDPGLNPIVWQHETLTARVSYSKWALNAQGVSLGTHGDQVMTTVAVQIRSTNAPGEGWTQYSALQNETVGEARPLGLAAEVYAAVSVLQWQGSVVLPGAECTAIGMGNLFNVSGGAAAWTTMNAMIVGVDHDIDAGKTTVNVGPHDHLNPDQLMELVRATRIRFNWTNPATVVSGINTAGGQVDLGQAVPKDNSTSEGGSHSRKIVSVPDPTDGTGVRTIDLDLNPIGHQTDGQQPEDLGLLGTGQFLNVGPKVLRVCSTDPDTGVTIHRWMVTYSSHMFSLPGDPIDS